MEELDSAYIRHRLHSTVTRVNHEVSAQILTHRRVFDDEPEQPITAEEWLAAHADALTEDDRHRPVTEDDLADTDTTEPRHTHEDDTRVSGAGEVATETLHAQRALHEIAARELYDLTPIS